MDSSPTDFTFLVTDIYLQGSVDVVPDACLAVVATGPAAAAPEPTTGAGSVVSSIFSSPPYVDAGGVDTNPNWGQATVTTVETVAGNSTLKMAGLNYQGIDFVYIIVVYHSNVITVTVG